MYSVPEWFQERLESEHAGSMRIRWSKARGEWHIEERIGRAALLPIQVSEIDDDTIRARDGYGYLMSVRPGTRMPCPFCGLSMSVPIRETSDALCANCKSRSRRSHWVTGFWPLDETLLEYLRKLTRLDTLKRIQADEVHWAAEQRRDTESQDREDRAYGVDKVIESLPTFRYSGKTSAWADK